MLRVTVCLLPSASLTALEMAIESVSVGATANVAGDYARLAESHPQHPIRRQQHGEQKKKKWDLPGKPESWCRSPRRLPNPSDDVRRKRDPNAKRHKGTDRGVRSRPTDFGTRAKDCVHGHQDQRGADAERAGIGGQRAGEPREVVRWVEDPRCVRERVPRNERSDRERDSDREKPLRESTPVPPCVNQKRKNE